MDFIEPVSYLLLYLDLHLAYAYSKEYNMIRKSQANKVQSGLYHQTSHRLCFAHSPRLKIDTANKHRLIYTLNNGFAVVVFPNRANVLENPSSLYRYTNISAV